MKDKTCKICNGSGYTGEPRYVQGQGYGPELDTTSQSLCTNCDGSGEEPTKQTDGEKTEPKSV